MDIRAVFCDVDGTLLNDEHRISQGTADAVRALQERGIRFVIVSARSPSGLYPILKRYGFTCPLICYSGALVLGEDRSVLRENGMDAQAALSVLRYTENRGYDLAWNLYSYDRWIVRSTEDERIIREQDIVEARAKQAESGVIGADEKVHKLLLICRESDTDQVAEDLSGRFPALTVVRSSGILVEVMNKGVDKARAAGWLLDSWGLRAEEAMAFGDQYNDLEMLRFAGTGIAMGNAPEQVRAAAEYVTEDNNSGGIEKALKRFKVI